MTGSKHTTSTSNEICPNLAGKTVEFVEGDEKDGMDIIRIHFTDGSMCSIFPDEERPNGGLEIFTISIALPN